MIVGNMTPKDGEDDMLRLMSASAVFNVINDASWAEVMIERTDC